MNGLQTRPVLSRREGAVGILALNRPAALNALSQELLEELESCLERASREPGLRAVVLAASGDRAFCVGADLKLLAGETDGTVQIDALLDTMHRVYRRVESFERPVIAAIHGHCLGGGLELALCADLRVAADNACFALPEAKIGSLPGGGGTQRLPRLIGPARAKELMFTGESVNAAEACRIGLVNRVVPADSLLEETTALAAIIAQRAPLSLRGIKDAVAASLDRELEAGLRLERSRHDALRDSADRHEGIRAFVEKRLPVFTGR